MGMDLIGNTGTARAVCNNECVVLHLGLAVCCYKKSSVLLHHTCDVSAPRPTDGQVLLLSGPCKFL